MVRCALTCSVLISALLATRMGAAVPVARLRAPQYHVARSNSRQPHRPLMLPLRGGWGFSGGEEPVQCRIHVYANDTLPGDELLMLGSAEALGAWNKNAGLRLTTSPDDFPWWTASMEVKKGASFEFKFAIRRRDTWGQIALMWEDVVENRRVEIPNGATNEHVINDLQFGEYEVPGSPIRRRTTFSPIQPRSLGKDPQFFAPEESDIDEEFAPHEDEQDEQLCEQEQAQGNPLARSFRALGSLSTRAFRLLTSPVWMPVVAIQKLVCGIVLLIGRIGAVFHSLVTEHSSEEYERMLILQIRSLEGDIRDLEKAQKGLKGDLEVAEHKATERSEEIKILENMIQTEQRNLEAARGLLKLKETRFSELEGTLRRELAALQEELQKAALQAREDVRRAEADLTALAEEHRRQANAMRAEHARELEAVERQRDAAELARAQSVAEWGEDLRRVEEQREAVFAREREARARAEAAEDSLAALALTHKSALSAEDRAADVGTSAIHHSVPLVELERVAALAAAERVQVLANEPASSLLPDNTAHGASQKREAEEQIVAPVKAGVSEQREDSTCSLSDEIGAKGYSQSCQRASSLPREFVLRQQAPSSTSAARCAQEDWATRSPPRGMAIEEGLRGGSGSPGSLPASSTATPAKPVARKIVGESEAFKGATSQAKDGDDEAGWESSSAAVEKAISAYRHEEGLSEAEEESWPSRSVSPPGGRRWTSVGARRKQATSGGLFIGLEPFLRMPAQGKGAAPGQFFF